MKPLLLTVEFIYPCWPDWSDDNIDDDLVDDDDDEGDGPFMN